MYELIQVGEKTYYINCPAKIGVFVAQNQDIYLIDSGNDKDTSRKVHKIIIENKWNLIGIINTHSNADHIGGNNLLQQRTNCKIISTKIENTFTNNPILEPSFLYGGFPCKDLRNKFLMATSSEADYDIENSLPKGLEYIRLGGHFFDMIGIKTSDGIYFLADSIFGENIISKYHLVFIYNVKEYLNTLDIIDEMEAKLFIPSHADACTNAKPLVQVNRLKVYEILKTISDICKEPIIFEDILKRVFDAYELTMDFNQYVLIGSTVKSYLSYLFDEGNLTIKFENNQLFWYKTNNVERTKTD